MTETTTMQAVLVPLVEAEIEEQLVATQWFYPGDRWNSGYPPFRRILRWLLGRWRVDDGLPLQCVLAVTPTRVLVYKTSTAGHRFHLSALAREWPCAQVTGSVRTVEMSSYGGGDQRMYAKSFRRATLETPAGRLVADLPCRERASQQLVAALRLSKTDKPQRRRSARRTLRT